MGAGHFILLLSLWLCPLIAHAGQEAWPIPVTPDKDGWITYENPRFGFSLPVPRAKRILRPPDDGDSQGFISPDGKVKLSSWGSFNIDRPEALAGGVGAYRYEHPPKSLHGCIRRETCPVNHA